MKILIADDDLTSRLILKALLLKQGHEVTVTCDGAEAWFEMQKKGSPRLVILDWIMPKINGVDLCRMAREKCETSSNYIILLTALNSKQNLLEGLQAGADDYLSKPFDDDILKARIGVGERVITLQLQLQKQASTDVLTSLANRRAGLLSLKGELNRASRDTHGIAVGIIDIDYFKRINDTYGHLTGDDVLREFGLRLRSVVRSYDQACRYGGEEFLLIMPGGDVSTSLRWERIKLAVTKTTFKTRSGPLKVTLSLGYSWDFGENSVDTIIAAADRALYEAKANGRDQVVGSAIK